MPRTKKEQSTINAINEMSRVEMARLWRFTPLGHPYFDILLPYYDVFQKRFKKLGGFSPAISKEIGIS